MTVRLFGFDALLTALFCAIDNRVRWFVRGGAEARSMAGRRRKATAGRQLAYFDDRMLIDIGLRRDSFPSVARERLLDRAMRFHI